MAQEGGSQEGRTLWLEWGPWGVTGGQEARACGVPWPLRGPRPTKGLSGPRHLVTPTLDKTLGGAQGPEFSPRYPKKVTVTSRDTLHLGPSKSASDHRFPLTPETTLAGPAPAPQVPPVTSRPDTHKDQPHGDPAPGPPSPGW